MYLLSVVGCAIASVVRLTTTKEEQDGELYKIVKDSNCVAEYLYSDDQPEKLLEEVIGNL